MAKNEKLDFNVDEAVRAIKKMEKDAEHVFESHKYGGYFVTNDHRILAKREEILKISNARILRPTELLESLENEYA